jgi:hypothetical protein
MPLSSEAKVELFDTALYKGGYRRTEQLATSMLKNSRITKKRLKKHKMTQKNTKSTEQLKPKNEEVP